MEIVRRTALFIKYRAQLPAKSAELRLGAA